MSSRRADLSRLGSRDNELTGGLQGGELPVGTLTADYAEVIRVAGRDADARPDAGEWQDSRITEIPPDMDCALSRLSNLWAHRVGSAVKRR